MANAFTSAHAELAACQSAEFGEACEVTIGTQTVAAVIYANMLTNTIPDGGGGLTEGGTQLVAVTKALLTDFAGEPNGEPPKNVTKTIVRGVEAFVLEVDERDGVFYITTGNPEAQE